MLERDLLQIGVGALAGAGATYLITQTGVKTIKDIVQNYQPGNNEVETIKKLYRTLWGREADSDGLMYWSGILQTNQDIVVTIIEIITAGKSNELGL